MDQFTLSPENLENEFMILRRHGIDLLGSDTSNKMSLAQSFNLCAIPPTVILGKSVAPRIAAARGSIARQKSKGDRGEPCLVPLPNLK